MKPSSVLFLVAFAADTLASWGLSKNAYNRWHETELERWLSDHDIDYPKPADRKDLEKLLQDNWQSKVISVYEDWEIPQLRNYLTETGLEIDNKQKESKYWLVQQVKSGWHETEKTAQSAYQNVNDWIFDSWSETQLKQFLDRHGITNPTPNTHEHLVTEARKNYLHIAEKLGESSAYPGNWLYETWSESDLKRWLDERGYPAPQPTTRDKLIASVRRNSRLASLKANKGKEYSNNVINDSIFDSWSEKKLQEFLKKNKVQIPTGSAKQELLALARRNKNYLGGDKAFQTATSIYNQASSTAGSIASQATDTAYEYYAFDTIIEKWSDSKLKAYLDARGIPVPQASKRDELQAEVRRNKHQVASSLGPWVFESWSCTNLKNFLESQGQKVSEKTSASQGKLASQAWSYVKSMSESAAEGASSSGASMASKAKEAAANAASKATDVVEDGAARAASTAKGAMGDAASQATDAAENLAHKVGGAASDAVDSATEGSKQAYASLTSAISEAATAAKESGFETWSDSDLKAYLDSYGIPIYQGSTRNEWIAMSRRISHSFRYGGDDQGFGGYIQSALSSSKNFIMSILGMGSEAVGKVTERVQEKAKTAQDEATARAKTAYTGAKNEL